MNRFPLRAIAVAAATTLALGVGVSQAQAVTWTKTASTTHKAYAVNNFKAKVGPSAAPAVSGYSRYATTVSIKNSAGAYVATNVANKWLGKGTYKVYSTFKYRKQVATTTSVQHVGNAPFPSIENPECVIVNVDLFPDGFGPDATEPGWMPTANCTGTYQGHPLLAEQFQIWPRAISELPLSAVGDTFGTGSVLWDLFAEYNANALVGYDWYEKVTTYTWAYTNRYHWRYATVTKVYPPRATWTNCTSVNAVFVHGVGKTTAVDKTTGTRVTTFLKNNELYALAVKYNAGLDRDKDGIACEKR